MAKAARPVAKKPSATPAKAATASPIMTTAQVAELFEITAERVRQLVKSGHIEKRGKDQVPLVSAVRGYIRFLKDDERRSSKSASASRVQDARAEEIALRVAEKKGTLLAEAQAEAIGVIDEFAGGLRADLMAIPAQVTRDLALRRQIEDRINGAFGAASTRAATAADRVASTVGAVEAEASNKPGQVGR